ncbi:MAG: hypothetical protein HC835_06485 [Oscillatoriales cyanobacterium RM2_1_1]|nr:hypothetical protein [Oscillatoriales cyanobacterium SM2_3_0]NJO45296.1 hypothetical protein [Oscillatoriales cyanobacterium RM2_1_1]
MPRSEFPTVIQPDTQTVESETVESEIVESESSALEVTPSDPSPLNHASATPPETSPGSEASKDNGFKHFAPNVLDSQIRTEIPEDQANPTQPPRPQLPALPAQTQQPQIPPPNPPQPIHHSAFSSPPQSAPEPTLESLRDIPLPRLDSQLPSQFEAHYGSMDQIEQLILSIQSSDPAIRSKAIWELGQHSDSRAIQPLVDLLVGSDSKQRSLILAALSEIGSRALKPMNRALTFSLQDENAEVRKNAIRDLTRVYDLILQMSQLLQRAVYDPDPDVQETAEWAIDKLSRIRPLPIADRKRE